MERVWGLGFRGLGFGVILPGRFNRSGQLGPTVQGCGFAAGDAGASDKTDSNQSFTKFSDSLSAYKVRLYIRPCYVQNPSVVMHESLPQASSLNPNTKTPEALRSP